jgi:hypothetical protein
MIADDHFLRGVLREAWISGLSPEFEGGTIRAYVNPRNAAGFSCR